MRLLSPLYGLYGAAVHLLLWPTRPLAAQTAAAPRPQPAAWLAYSGEHPISAHFAVIAEAQSRYVETFDGAAQLLFRSGLAYARGSRLKLSSGYMYVSTRAGAGAAAFHFPEHRLWEVAQLSHGAGPALLAHRVRLEQRRALVPLAAPDGTPVPGEWVTSHRARYQLRSTVPMSEGGGQARLYASVADELFASSDGGSAAFAVDQNRASVALGFRASPTLRVEASYINQASVSRGPRLAVRTHALQVTALSNTPLFR